MSERVYDFNNWYEVLKNPISKVGVFPYLGASIGAPDQSKIYQVLRPEEELSDPECMKSFRLLPWIDEHTMLGDDDDEENGNVTPPEEVGIQGVIGENIIYEGGTLYANIKVFSKRLAELIAKGKRELSCGYRCVYVHKPGTWNGKPYEYVQKNLRGNHLALVEEGRMGPDVAVLDHFKFTVDSAELIKVENAEKKTTDEGTEGDMTLAQVAAAIKSILPIVEQLKPLITAGTEPGQLDEEPEPSEKTPTDEEEIVTDEEEGKDDVPTNGEKPATGTDATEIKRLKAQMKSLQATVDGYEKNGMKKLVGQISARDQLANRLSVHIGAFDHSEKTLDEVVKYGVAKLGIKCAKGQEHGALNGYLLALDSIDIEDTTVPRFAADAGIGNDDAVNKYLSGE
ncbi:DUF2213 domain-containing protein [Jinshanibacter sp. LJY008]|uniref:DUF2213 domain-containing protein n=1 Tax=Limnobaculum eriocheiris TaxID=2897391 RepID=A0A9X1MU81_9GAMM|nr:DUF2213 domain-containing protein [Limnobaculum eriocheiris]MCD1124817.1 DUF2213 domain-containing protein [Limnobaculum eriocheiris]